MGILSKPATVYEGTNRNKRMYSRISPDDSLARTKLLQRKSKRGYNYPSGTKGSQ